MATEPMVIFGPGQCRECGNNLVVLDSECTVLVLEDDGSPRVEETVTKLVAKCPHCKKEYKMLRKGLGYEHDNPSVRLERWFDHKLRCENAIKAMEELKAPKDNPFFLPRMFER